MDLFDIKLTAEDIRFKKPNPRAFKVLLDRLSVLPEEAVYVGDLLYDDVVGSQSAGMKAVWIKRRENEDLKDIQPDATIHQLSELLDVLEAWR
jgi:putative hydrolase of the HAD superfamily